MARALVFFVAVLFGILPGIAGAQQTLRHQMLTLGVSEEVVLVDHPTLQLGTLTSGAGAIVRVAVRESRSFLSQDGTAIQTDYRAAVVDVIKDSSEVGVGMGEVITIRRLGGIVDIEGRRFCSQENGFPPFTSGGEYLLFLKRDPGQPYTMLTGPQSAFRIHQGSVTPIAASVDLSTAPRADLSQFVQEVRQLLNYPVYSSR